MLEWDCQTGATEGMDHAATEVRVTADHSDLQSYKSCETDESFEAC